MLGSLAKVIGLSIASLGNFNMPTKTAEEQTHTYTNADITTTPDLSWTYTQATPPFTWNYNKKSTAEQTNTTNATYRSTQFQQRVYNDQMDYVQIEFDNTKLLQSYMLIEMETIPNPPQYLEIWDLRISLVGTWQGVQILNINVDIYVSYEQTWQKYFATNEYIDDTSYSLTNEVDDMKTANMIVQQSCEELAATSINHTNMMPNDMDDNPIEITKNPTIPLYILVVATADRSLNEVINDDWYIEISKIRIGYSTYDQTAYITQEVIDLPGLCFSILTMPFSFISQAFNLTLFPGTAYQLNISTLFLSIIGILIFVFIVKKLVNR